MDISFCLGHNELYLCPKRDQCRRYIESLKEDKHSIMQSWIEAPFVFKESGVSCEMFLNVKYD